MPYYSAMQQPRETGTWFLVALGAMPVALVSLFGLGWFVFGASSLVGVLYLCYLVRHLLFATCAAQWGERDLHVAADLTYTPAVSVIVACKDEELVVDALVSRLLALEYPEGLLQVIVVDDNSDDRTGQILDAHAADNPGLWVVHRPPGSAGGKSGALNDASRVVTGEVVVIFDADHQPTPETVRRLVRHFADPKTAAVMGRCVINNRDDSLVSRVVWLEYLAGYRADEYGRQAVFQLPAYGGANCAVRVSALNEVGGYNEESVTEDTDLTLRLILMGYRVRYDISAVDFEQAVTSLATYRRQRYRWAFGHQKVWRDYLRHSWRTPHLSLLEKIETTMFLWLYHVPVVTFLGFFSIPYLLLDTGVAAPAWARVLVPILMAGPFLPIAVGLLQTPDARPRHAWMIGFLFPVIIAFAFTCTRGWLDGVRGKGYRWAKTARTARP